MALPFQEAGPGVQDASLRDMWCAAVRTIQVIPRWSRLLWLKKSILGQSASSSLAIRDQPEDTPAEFNFLPIGIAIQAVNCKNAPIRHQSSLTSEVKVTNSDHQMAMRISCTSFSVQADVPSHFIQHR